MINLPSLNKLFTSIILIMFIVSASLLCAEEPSDIWKKKEKKIAIENNTQNNILNESETDKDLKVDLDFKISEEQINKFDEDIVGLIDPEINNLNLNMWITSDGQEIKKVLERINNLQLSKFSKDLFFRVLFTNAYPPRKNLSSNDFLNFKVNWLIKENRVEDLENLLNKNPEIGEKTKVINFLLEEYIATANITSACEKAQLIDKNIQHSYLDKFTILCLVNENRMEEAQTILDLLIERGFNDKSFENRINFLMGFSEKKEEKILDDNLLDFHLSRVVIDNFDYKPNKNTNKYIWRYLSSANLLNTEDLEEIDNQKLITLYEKAAAEDSFDVDEIFNIYKRFLFNINQYINVDEVYKTLPNYKARALVYQSILITDEIEKKLKLIFLLKDLFDKDKIFNAYSKELSSMLKIISEENSNKIPQKYASLVEKHLINYTQDVGKIKFDNKIIHRSKALKYFLEDNYEIKKAQKDLDSVYKKIRKNKKYFISIKDIILLESLKEEGVNLPASLDYKDLTISLTIPEGLNNLAVEKQTGLVLLKVIEIIGEDKIRDLDPETIYFLNKILNQLKLKKIRNDILYETLPIHA